MVLYDATRVKTTMAEQGVTNNTKIAFYGEMGDRRVLEDLMRIPKLTFPLVVTPGVITSDMLTRIQGHATELAIAYFFKFESGDNITAEQAEANWDRFFRKFFHPRFKVSTGSR